MSLALYRKYRPKKLADLLGQEHITEVIKNAAKLDRLAHGYLFYGPRGSGKTTLARLIAKIACCEKRQKDEKFKAKGEPCNACTVCEEIDAGRGIDVIEIDAASNRGIDEIRSLKEGIRMAPTSYPFKVVIIDETHMLTKEAFNALLKTLEEPPSHAILILATTEFEKVPATITSRTQRFHFKRHDIATISKKLSQIAKQENIEIENDALELIAALGEGSFRDAESLLQQVASLADNITLEIVEKNLGKVGFNRTAELADKILSQDLKAALSYIRDINEAGYNVVDLTKELIQYLRRVLTLATNPDLETSIKKELTTKELEQLKTHAKLITSPSVIANPPKAGEAISFVINLLKSLIRAYSEMRYSPFASIPLEIAIIENLKESHQS